jgi:short-subunit dehydrogenase
MDVSKPIEHLSTDQVTHVITMNLLGPMYLCLETCRRMVARGNGHIVNILSTASRRTWAGAAPYAAGKLGLRAFRPTLFQEAQRDCLDIDVIGIIAGGMEAPFILERFHDADTSSSGTWRSSPTPCCTRCRCPRPARWTKSSSSRATSRPDRSSRTRSTSPINLFVQSFDPAAEQRSDR